MPALRLRSGLLPACEMETPPPKPPGLCPGAPRPSHRATAHANLAHKLDLPNDDCGYVSNLKGDLAKYNGSIATIEGPYVEELTMRWLMKACFDGKDGNARFEMPTARDQGVLELYVPIDTVLQLSRPNVSKFLEQERRYEAELNTDPVSMEEFRRLEVAPFPAQFAFYVVLMDKFFDAPRDQQGPQDAPKAANSANSDANSDANPDANPDASNEAPGARKAQLRQDGFSRLDFEAEHSLFETEFFAQITVERLRNPAATEDQLAKAAHALMDEFEAIMPARLRAMYAYERYCVSSFDGDNDSLPLLNSLLPKQLYRAPELRANVVSFGA